MYPTISEFLKTLGINLPLPIQTFGFFVALAFLSAAYILSRELRRKEKEGLLKKTSKRVTVGRPATGLEYLTSGIIGFVLGFKLVHLITDYSQFVSDPQGSLLSTEGNLLGGLLGATGLVYWRYRESEKQRLDKPKEVTVEVHPEDHMGQIILLGVVGGLVGAKIFHNLENLDEFMADPVGSLFSFSGLTFYGGLILAAYLIIRYARKNGLSAIHLCDAAAPALILAYGIGRIGCQAAGDGDWGILNSAYVTTPDGTTILATGPEFEERADTYLEYYKQSFEGVKEINQVSDIPHKPVIAPSWLPVWMVASTYPHNVNSDGIPIAGTDGGKWNRRLPLPVFPTPFYETVMSLLIFGVLWLIRKRIIIPGMLFSIYLVFNGTERFFIEKIRVNTELFGMGITQAEIISFALILLGIAGIIYTRRHHAGKQHNRQPA